MNILSQYITFLKEYKKLLERGVKDILNSNVSNNFIWLNEIEDFTTNGACESTLLDIFTSRFEGRSPLLYFKKPSKPSIKIPTSFIETIRFDELKNKFESIKDDEDDLLRFENSADGKNVIEELKQFNKTKEVYSKLYRAYNDIKNDTNLEFVLSLGLIQYSKRNSNGNLSKTNQHLFHFPLLLDLDSNSNIKISLSRFEIPYADFFFLNNAPIEKEILSNIIATFEQYVSVSGCDCIYEKEFRYLIEKTVQNISSNSEFEDSIYRPAKDYYHEDCFKISFSPAINIKHRKPRFFEKLTDSIIKYSEDNNIDASLFNLLVRNPESVESNLHPKNNYFTDTLFETYKDIATDLTKEDDFSVFFPLPFNKEQKEIYENYLQNRLTVVTGPPGTGKSHTIVNILCSLLAQGKRVLVTAQTDKALESLLDKIPETFDDLIFTKIQLETNQNRFTLEKSIGNISNILTSNFHSNVEAQIQTLNRLKKDYLQLKADVIKALEKEYSIHSINSSFNNIRAYQIVEKFELKEAEEWSWIRDELTQTELSEFESIRQEILEYKDLSDCEIKYTDLVDIDIQNIILKMQNFDFNNFISLQRDYNKNLDYLGLTEDSKNNVLNIQLEPIANFVSKFSNSDIVLTNLKELEKLQKSINLNLSRKNLTANKTYSDLTKNGTQYLIDIETYLSLAEGGKVPFFTRMANSNFKQVSYLEQFTINGKKCNNRTGILLLKTLIESLIVINKNLRMLEQSGYTFVIDDISNLLNKFQVLEDTMKKLEINKNVVSFIQSNSDFIKLSEYCHIDVFDIESLSRKAILLKEDINRLYSLNEKLVHQKEVFNDIITTIEQSSIKLFCTDFIPASKISDAVKFEQFKSILSEICKQLEKEEKLIKLTDSLRKLLPNTFDFLKNIPIGYISQDNFEYANVNQFLKTNTNIDIQKCKENITSINNKIFQTKCNILFDLAKTNFKDKFEGNAINTFINDLVEYRHNLAESVRKIRNQAQYQVLTQKKSIAISKKLSCWVMKFNDVLNSIGDEPEVFDCIIVDEASQLDFNSLILSYYAKSMIIVGDDKQTSPSSLTGADGNDFEAIKKKYLSFLGDNIIHIKSDNSLFMLAKMVAGTSNLTLKEHFRCVPEIIEFSKREFYDNALRPLKQITSNRLNPKETHFVNNAFTEDKIVYKEVEEIKQFLQKILNDSRYANKSIGLVSLGLTKHTERLKDIKEDLVSEFGRDKIDKHKLIIEDSPKFQGDERDVMIVSLGVALDSQKLEDNLNAKPRAILNDQEERRKINVALSRAKEQMILFHSVKSDDLQLNDFRRAILAFFNEEIKPISPLILEDYNIERDRHNVPELFDSWFEYDVAKLLIERGYSYIQPQYKVKEDETFYNQKLDKYVYINFKLDLVVYNNDRMIAIECDGDPFHSLPKDVAYDMERQEFLERVGWKVYRILYSAFKRNGLAEIDRMIDFIEQHTKKANPTIIETKMSFENEVSYNINIEEDNDHQELFNNTIEAINSEDEIQAETNYNRDIVDSRNLTTKHPQDSNQLDLFAQESKVLCYFNLFEDNTYKIQEYPKDDCLFSLPIQEKYKDGYLLQCYDNGCVNKVHVKSILEKRTDYHYSNGKHPHAKILLLKLIEEDSIISLRIKRGLEIVFKAHKTEEIPERELLHLLGKKVVYQGYDKIEYNILPETIKNDIQRLVFKSFSAEGKLIKNNYYQSEWNIIEKYIPSLKKDIL